MAASDNRRPSGGHTLFRYTAKDIDGRTVRGTMEAAVEEAAAEASPFPTPRSRPASMSTALSLYLPNLPPRATP